MEDPLPIRDALGSDTSKARFSVGTFLLLAGFWHFRRRAPVPMHDLELLGFAHWHREKQTSRSKLRIEEVAGGSARRGILRQADSEMVGADGIGRLATAIERALQSGEIQDTGRAVLAGLQHPSRLLRTCAHAACVGLFRLTAFDVDYLRSVYPFADFHESDEQAEEIEMSIAASIEALLRRYLRGDIFEPYPPAASLAPNERPGLMLIHGTNMPGSRPDWSVPGSGELFRHIQTNLRPDVYAGSDFFRWEGGYSDYAREVAAENICRWVSQRDLAGIDVVAHSHGGNVVLKATELGCKFGEILLLSCPVHSAKYRLRPGHARRARSVRIHLDWVLLLDYLANRSTAVAAQHFPSSSGIEETILPHWFYDHSTTNKLATWEKYNIAI